ncbi:DUF4197 domain-containing protein [Flavobacterium sp.]|uniref:DUF4197 domain-containing protein n=1 Tax=Flavobacterium sp. TaxID=239 RepID=UPI00260E96B4|nr:DUF4197 domain-containing protein [Flavobacterium sp.]
MKKLFLLLLVLPIAGNAQLKGLVKKASEKVNAVTKNNGTVDIAAGLKEALNKGVSEQVSKLTAVDGFYKNEAVKILMPEELQKVDKALRKMGMGKLADDGIKALNRAAEDAVKEATPIFVDAIKNMTVKDAKNILMGSDNAATVYLQGQTTTPLYAKFNPIVKQSIGKVGADVIWESIIKKYNAIPLVTKVNPDINDYVTNKALDGVFTMITVEEKNIRNNLESRTSDLLRKVFAMQDQN